MSTRLLLVGIALLCVTLGLAIFADVNENALAAEAPTVTPPKLEFSSDSKFAGAASVMAVSPALSNIIIYAGGSKPVATIHPDGTVELGGTPNEAARAFWHAVELMFPVRCAKP